MSTEVASTKGFRSNQFPHLPAEGEPLAGGSRSSTGRPVRIGEIDLPSQLHPECVLLLPLEFCDLSADLADTLQPIVI